MNGKKKKDHISFEPSTGEFRPGPAGTYEAFLYEFSNERVNLDVALDPEKTIVTTRRVAESSMLQAVEYMAKHEPNFRSCSVRMIGLVVLLSGSRYI